MLYKISLIFVFLRFLTVADSSYGQTVDIVHPFEGQVFANEVEVVWNANHSSALSKVFISTDSTFTATDSFIVNNKGRFTFFPDSSLNQKYFFYISQDQNGQIESSDTSSFIYFNPKNLSGLKLWVSSDFGVDTLMGAVQLWADRSGNGNHLSIAKSSKRPTYIPQGLNGLPDIFFDEVDDGLSSPFIIDSTDFLMTVLYNCMDSTKVIRRTIHGNYGNWLAGKYGSSYNVFAGSFTGGVPYVPYVYMLQSIRQIGDTVENFLISNFEGSTKAAYYPGQVGIGGWSGSAKVNGNVNEWLVYDTTISDSLRLLIEKYVMDKYAPPLSLGQDMFTCNFPLRLNAKRDYIKSYLWSDSSTASFFDADSAGTYYLSSTDIFGRTFIDSIQIFFDSSSSAIQLPADTTLCLGSNLQLNAGPERYTYSWNTGSSASSIMVDSAATYVVTRTNCVAQTSIDSIVVKINQPAFSLGQDTLICFNSVLVLSPDSSFGSNVGYAWSNGSSSPSISVDSAATFILKVTDGASCTFSDSIAVHMDSSLMNISLGPDTSLCKGNSIGLKNSNPFITSYQWSTGSLDSTIVPDSSQTYSVVVTSVNCSFTDSIDIKIKALAPEVSFSAHNFCFGDSVQFTDSSRSLDQSAIIGWKWEHGSFAFSQAPNPAYPFDSVGTKTIKLTVETDSGCFAEAQKQIEVYPLPKANFAYSLACEGDEVEFSDSSSISNGRVMKYIWNLDNQMSDTSRNPSYTFNSYGDKMVSLVVVSGQTCRDSLQKFIHVNPVPKSSIQSKGFCFGDSTFFQSSVIIEEGSIDKLQWNFGNGRNGTGANSGTFYYQPGRYAVFFKATSEKGCSSVTSDSLQIVKPPVADFSGLEFCEGQLVEIKSESLTWEDSIRSFLYIFDSSDTSFKVNPVFSPAEVGAYQVQLFIESALGCQDSTSKTVSVLPNPIADFMLLKGSAPVPAQLQVKNTSQNAVNFVWDFGNGDTESAEVPNYIYQDTGSFQLKLTAFNRLGCSDSTERTFLVLPSFLDAFLEEVKIIESSGFIEMKAMVTNSGRNNIDQLDFLLEFEGGLNVTRKLEVDISAGNSAELSVADNFYFAERPNYLCMEIVKVNGKKDEREENNRQCLALNSGKLSIDLFPNPAKYNISIHLVLPKSGKLLVNIIDALGGKMEVLADAQYVKGLHTFSLPLQNFPTGTYVLEVLFDGEVTTKKFTKY